MKRLFGTFAVAALSLALAGSAPAANIAFGPASNVSSNSDVSIGSNTLDRAYSFGSADNLVIQGIPFKNFGSTGGTNFAGDVNNGLDGTYNGFGSPAGPTGDYATLLSNGHYHDGGATSLVFNNLVKGTTYQISVFVNDSREPGCCPGGGRTLTVSGDTVAGAGTLLYDQLNGTSGQFVTGTFVADGTGSQTLNIDLAPGSTSNNQINGVLLSYAPAVTPVPEPASMLLLGLGALGMGGYGLRRRSV